ncbi:MAG TPA: glycosyltransferase family 4 protein, partial [Pyrinomonadaceae bacterium]|nr:glycosyltransferase family 4 protein [Pyrinomonadaceae bacterium]
QVGGAEKVHADIVACVAERRPWVFFTNQSKDTKFKPLFEKHARLFDISFLTLGSLRYYGYVGALASLINRHEGAVVFGSNTVFFYHLISHLRKDVRRIDLLHNFGGGIEQVSLPFAPEIDTRVICIGRTLSDLETQYAAGGVEPRLLDRVELIRLQVSVPDAYTEKQRGQALRVLYVGRAAREKRVHLVCEAARRCRQMKIRAEFTLVGVTESEMDERFSDSCIFKGEIADPEALYEIYDRADVLVLTSVYEGASLVVMEAMAHGAVPLSTDVGGISDHVKHNINGILIENGEEEQIVDALCEAVYRLERDRSLLEEMSREAYLYARQHFAPQRFCAAYCQLLLREKPTPP